MSTRVWRLPSRTDREDERHRNVDQEKAPGGQQGREDEQRPHPVHPDVGVAGKAGADARQPLPLLDPTKPSGPRRGVASDLWLRVAAGVDGPDGLKDAIDVSQGDQAVFGADRCCELVADRPFEIAEDLRPIGIVPKPGGSPVEILRQPVVRVVTQPVSLGMSVQGDDDGLVHGYLPSSSMSEVRDAQYARNSARWARPRSVRR